jgi:hypothetical protein
MSSSSIWTTFSYHQDRNTNLLQNIRSNPLYYMSWQNKSLTSKHICSCICTCLIQLPCSSCHLWQWSGKNTIKRSPGQRILLLAHQHSLKLWPETDLKVFHHFSMFNTCLHLKIKLLQYNLSQFQADCIMSSDNPTPVTCINCTICFPLRTSRHTSTKRWSKCPSLQTTQHVEGTYAVALPHAPSPPRPPDPPPPPPELHYPKQT